MTIIPRLFFDECLSRPVVETDLTQSLRLYGSDVEIAHLLTKFGSHGIGDSIWIPELAQEGGWIIFTCDQGKKSKKTEKLPEICQAYGVTHVMLSSGLHKKNMYYKALSIQTHWQAILELAEEPPGSGYRITMTSHGNFKIARVTEALPASRIIDPSATKHQSEIEFD